MPYPAISTLPASPSRLGDPNNFITESLAFLDAQAGFTSGCNAVSSYLNAAKFDAYNWGDLSAVTGGAPVYITNFVVAAPSVPPLNGPDLANAVDSVLSSMVAFVPDANTVGTWIDTLVNPSAPTVVDPTRPTVSSVNVTPLRNDGELPFESKAIAFYGSARLFSTSLQQFADYVATFSGGLEDWDSIAITYTDTDDWGLINE
jgi:hypothetical protein